MSGGSLVPRDDRENWRLTILLSGSRKSASPQRPIARSEVCPGERRHELCPKARQAYDKDVATKTSQEGRMFAQDLDCILEGADVYARDGRWLGSVGAVHPPTSSRETGSVSMPHGSKRG